MAVHKNSGGKEEDRERERIGNENKNRETTGEKETQCSELKTRRSINKNNRRSPMKITEIAKLKLDLVQKSLEGMFLS